MRKSLLNIMSVLTINKKVDVLCLDLFSNGSESICRSLWSFRSCEVPKDNN